MNAIWKNVSKSALVFAMALPVLAETPAAPPERAPGSWQEETRIEADSGPTGPMSLTLLSVSCVAEGSDAALLKQGRDQVDAQQCPDPTVSGEVGDWRYGTECSLQQGAMLMQVSGRLRGDLQKELVNEVTVDVSLPAMNLTMQTQAMTHMRHEGPCREGMQAGETRRVDKF